MKLLRCAGPDRCQAQPCSLPRTLPIWVGWGVRSPPSLGWGVNPPPGYYMSVGFVWGASSTPHPPPEPRFRPPPPRSFNVPRPSRLSLQRVCPKLVPTFLFENFSGGLLPLGADRSRRRRLNRWPKAQQCGAAVPEVLAFYSPANVSLLGPGGSPHPGDRTPPSPE